MADLNYIFCEIDDFCKDFEKYFGKRALSIGNQIRKRTLRMPLLIFLVTRKMAKCSGISYFLIPDLLSNARKEAFYRIIRQQFASCLDRVYVN